MIRCAALVICLISLLSTYLPASEQAANQTPLKLLFLGDDGHHQPRGRFFQLQAALAPRKIELTYTSSLTDLNSKLLTQFDGLVIYANQERIGPDQEKSLLDYVASGKGLVVLHCGSYCFLNSPKYIEMVGAQFRSHGIGVFRTEKAKVNHPILDGYDSFACWDETYVHHKHNEKDRTVLEYRTSGDVREPWTWVKPFGKGRVFYTAWGHDHRTWAHLGFQNLVERGCRWACGANEQLAASYHDRPKMAPLAKEVKPFEYVPAKVPFYPAGKQWGVTTEPISTMQKPLGVAESIKHYQVPEGFELRPFVTEEKLGGKPIAMVWDELGCLYVAITIDYPNELKPEGEGRDRILKCEDTDNDGVCDKVTVFADKLSIPTSLLPYEGGLIVHQAPVTLFLKDSDGDGKADTRQVLLEGWGTADTHAGPSSLRYGFDNWIYGMVGYSGFRGRVKGERVEFRSGLLRFKIEKDSLGKLEVTKLEFLRSMPGNSWGVGFNEEGLLFGSAANGAPSVFLAIPNRYYEKVTGITPSVLANIAHDNHIEPITEKVRQVDWHGGFTAAAGHALYTARTYPAEYWNRAAFVCEPTGHLVATMLLHPNGSDFVASYGWNLVAGNDEWISPIAAEVGPDGHMWIIDWYNYIVQHNPTPSGFRTGKGAAYETELRDKKFGRIYRLVYTKAPTSPPLSLKDASVPRLVELLKHDNMHWRLHAQRLLVSRLDPSAIPLLIDAIISSWSRKDPPGSNPQPLHALLTLGGYPVTELEKHKLDWLAFACDGSMPQLQRAAWTCLPVELASRMSSFSTKENSNPQVQLAAFLAMADSGKGSGKRLLREISPALLQDRWLREALIIAACRHAEEFLTGACQSRELPGGAMPVLELVARNHARQATGSLVPLMIAALGSSSSDVQKAILAGTSAGWPVGRTIELSAGDENMLRQALDKANPEIQTKVLQLAMAWGAKSFRNQAELLAAKLLAAAANDKIGEDGRLDAARQALDLMRGDDKLSAQVLDLIKPTTPPKLAQGVLDALAVFGSRQIGLSLVGKLKELPPSARPAATRIVLSRPQSANSFLDAVEQGKLRFDMLSLDQKNALASHPDALLSARAKKLLALGGGLPDANRQKVIESFAYLTKKTGNAGLGKLIFVQHCAKCHRHGSEGQLVGPDLTGMAVHPKEELLIHLLDPSRSVEGNYRAYVATLNDGRLMTGILTSESKTSIELADTEGKKHALARADLESLTETEKSLMPEGFEKQVSPDDLGNLLEFLTSKGRYVPIPLDKYATAVSTKGLFVNPDAAAERLIFPTWAPKEFKGVPFQLVDPRGDAAKNVILLYGPQGSQPPLMPRQVTIPCNTVAKAIHILGGIGGWNYPGGRRGDTSMIVRLHYEDGKTEDHPLQNGVHLADYIRRVDVPGSEFAFNLGGPQLRYLSVQPRRQAVIKQIELVKGRDPSAPVVMAVTVETPGSAGEK